jgi:hypothetical protein
MKKYILAAILMCNISIASAQTKKLEKINDALLSSQIGNPLVNGIPYSQYKAQQDALKQKQKQEKEKQDALQKREAEKANRIKLNAVKIEG